MKTRGVIMILFAIAALAGLSALVMLLWNLLIPDIFGLITIDFWQAAGLLILARLLFGRVGSGKKHMIMNRMKENPIHKKWRNMTPEQRKEFIEKRRKFGFGAPFGKDFFEMEKYGEQRKENE